MAIPAARLEAESPRSCSTCGRPSAVDERICPLCGERLGERSAWTEGAPVRFERVASAAVETPVVADGERLRDLWILGAGLLGAPVLAFLPITSFMGWFLGSLAHEMGHAAVAWLLGMPSVPAIRLDGHAAAVHGEQLVLLSLLMYVLLLGAPRFLQPRALRLGAVGVIALGYPLVAFTSLREVAHLLAGHAAELLLAGVFLWRATTGGFTSSTAERVTYAVVGWYLFGANLFLTLGLLGSQAVRDEYAGNGSFGLTNDYLRLVPSFGSLTVVAALMTLVALAVLPAVFFAWRAWRSETTA